MAGRIEDYAMAAAILVTGCHSSALAAAPSPDASSPLDAGTPVAPAWSASAADASSSLALALGHNTIWSRGGLGLWNDTTHLADPAVQSLVAALHPALLRFPGGTRAMRYHFAQAIGPLAQRVPQCDAFTGKTDATGYGIDEFMSVAGALGAAVSIVTPWVDGSPQEAAAFVAYVNADPSSAFALGTDASGKDWGTAGDWAKQRAANGHPAPYGAKFVEIGNEPYLGLPAGPPTGSCGRPSQFKQDERWVNGVAIPTTAKDYAAQLALTGALVRGVDPAIRIGAAVPATYDGKSDAAQALGDFDATQNDAGPWSPRLLSDAASAFDFFILHPYDFTTSDARLQLGEQTRKVIHDLRALAPAKGIGVTEFGFLINGDTALNAIVTADVIRIAIEEGVELVARHVLVEDVLTEPFASAALIGGPQHRLSPAYAVEQRLASVVPGATQVPLTQPAPDIALLALAEPDGSIAIVAIDRRENPPGASALAVALPSGQWAGTVDTMAPTSLDDTGAAFAAAPAAAANTLEVALPPNGIVVAHLVRR